MARTKSDGGPSMMTMVRTALDKLGMDAKPVALQEFIKSNFDKDVSKIIVSNYKSNIKKKGPGAKRRGRPPGSVAKAAAPVKASAGGKGIQLEDLAAVRGLVGRLGANQVRQLIDVLA